MSTASVSFSEITEVTIVDNSGRHYTPTRLRRPGDETVERISLRCGEEEATFSGAKAWRLAALMLKAWAYRAKLGRPIPAVFSVRFGDGVTYLGPIKLSRTKRPDLAAHCRTIEAFQYAFAQDLSDKRKLRNMLKFFLTSYEIPISTAKI